MVVAKDIEKVLVVIRRRRRSCRPGLLKYLGLEQSFQVQAVAEARSAGKLTESAQQEGDSTHFDTIETQPTLQRFSMQYCCSRLLKKVLEHPRPNLSCDT